MRERAFWLRKGKKIRVVFLGIVLRLKGEVTGSFHQPFSEIPMVCFLPDFFLFMFPRVMDSHLKWELNYCIPIYWSGRKFLYGVFYLYSKGFSTLYLVSFFMVKCSWLSFLILVKLLLFLRGDYYCWLVVILVEESFNLDRLIL